jgi:hypothetical protein
MQYHACSRSGERSEPDANAAAILRDGAFWTAAHVWVCEINGN